MQVFSKGFARQQVFLSRGKGFTANIPMARVQDTFRSSHSSHTFEIVGLATRSTLDSYLAQLLQKSHPLPAGCLDENQRVRTNCAVTLQQLGITGDLQYRGLGSLLRDSFPYGVGDNRRFEVVPKDPRNLPTVLELIQAITHHHQAGMLRDFIAPLCLDQTPESLEAIPGQVDRFNLKLKYRDATGKVVIEPKDDDLLVYSNLSLVDLASHPQGVLADVFLGKILNPAFRPVFEQLGKDYKALTESLSPAGRKIKYLVVLRHPAWDRLAGVHQGYRRARLGYFIGAVGETESGNLGKLCCLQNFPIDPNTGAS